VEAEVARVVVDVVLVIAMDVAEEAAVARRKEEVWTSTLRLKLHDSASNKYGTQNTPDYSSTCDCTTV
jgi:hypothetical protein